MIRLATLGFPSCPPPTYLSNLLAERGFIIVRWVLGLLLITTALMKMSGGSGEILRVALPFVSPKVYLSGVVFEFILGLWLIVCVAQAWSWLMSLLFFGLLGYMSFRLGWYGQASCGCAGKLALSPWWAFVIDGVAVTSLLLCRPKEIGLGLKRGLPAIGGAMVILACTSLVMVFWFGSTGSALARLHGELVSVSPAVGDVGSGKFGEVTELELTITNYYDRPIRIVGGTSNCSCIATDDLPIEVSPGASRSIGIKVKFTGTKGRFHRRFALYADIDKLKVMPVGVTGMTLEQ